MSLAIVYTLHARNSFIFAHVQAIKSERTTDRQAQGTETYMKRSVSTPPHALKSAK